MVTFWRQIDIVLPEDLAEFKITLIGAGGIGSFTALALGKMGVLNLELFDPDKVEAHNPPNQLYRSEDIGREKTEAMREICAEFSGMSVNPQPRRFDAENLSGVVLSGVDSMQSRREIWEKVRYNYQVLVYLDGRMGAEVLQIYTIRPCDPEDVTWYEKTLHPDKKVYEAPCTARAVIYTAFLMAGLMANLVKKLAKGEELPREIIFDVFNLTLLTG